MIFCESQLGSQFLHYSCVPAPPRAQLFLGLFNQPVSELTAHDLTADMLAKHFSQETHVL